MASELRPKSSDAKVIDLRVARAMRAMQQEPGRDWNVKRLAKVAGASRAAFARLFQKATGSSPKRWLRDHRLTLAAARLTAEANTVRNKT